MKWTVWVESAYSSFMFRNRRAFEITETLLKLMAAAAIIGLSKADIPKIGTRLPAATGIPKAL